MRANSAGGVVQHQRNRASVVYQYWFSYAYPTALRVTFAALSSLPEIPSASLDGLWVSRVLRIRPSRLYRYRVGPLGSRQHGESRPAPSHRDQPGCTVTRHREEIRTKGLRLTELTHRGEFSHGAHLTSPQPGQYGRVAKPDSPADWDSPTAAHPPEGISTATTPQAAASARLDAVAARAAAVGLNRIHILAWRDLADPEAGGSELHAHRVATLWARAGLDVTMRTSTAIGHDPYVVRDGYKVIRKSGRYTVFPRSALSGLLGRRGNPDGLVEVWNGMPFFSPIWARCPRVVFLHHVHAEMWRMVLSKHLGPIGELVERRVAPPLYRSSRVVTLSDSSRREIVDMLGLPASRVSVVPPGVGTRFTPGSVRSADPLVMAVGRLVPVKRFDLLVDALMSVRRSVPNLRAIIVGEGVERPRLESKIAEFGAQGWLSLPGRLDDEALLKTYRRAWVLACTSLREGWGMSITEAGACGTPAVVTRIAGHVDVVEHGVTGLLVDSTDTFAAALDAVLRDGGLRDRLGRGARTRAASLTWEAAAAGTLDALVKEAEARTRRSRTGDLSVTDPRC
jgi:glycosyltransferase involved in cell wall biosynthesis